MWRNGWYKLKTASMQRSRSRSLILVPIDCSYTTCSRTHHLPTIHNVTDDSATVKYGELKTIKTAFQKQYHKRKITTIWYDNFHRVLMSVTEMQSACWLIDWLSMVLRLRQHNIGLICMCVIRVIKYFELIKHTHFQLWLADRTWKLHVQAYK